MDTPDIMFLPKSAEMRQFQQLSAGLNYQISSTFCYRY